MATRRERAEPALRPSVLDRLLTPAGAAAGGPRHQHEAVGLQELRAAVERDLEWLLNTRQCLSDPGEDHPEAARSIWTYGLPDLSGFSPHSAGDRVTIANQLEEVIRRFEPRLRPGTIKVSPRPSPEGDEARLCFRIDAVLDVDPIRSPVSFDTDIDTRAGSVEVRGES